MKECISTLGRFFSSLVLLILIFTLNNQLSRNVINILSDISVYRLSTNYLFTYIVSIRPASAFRQFSLHLYFSVHTLTFSHRHQRRFQYMNINSFNRKTQLDVLRNVSVYGPPVDYLFNNNFLTILIWNLSYRLSRNVSVYRRAHDFLFVNIFSKPFFLMKVPSANNLFMNSFSCNFNINSKLTVSRSTSL